MQLTTVGSYPEAVVDIPRFYITDGSSNSAVFLEDEMDENIVKELKLTGQILQSNVEGFGSFYLEDSKSSRGVETLV